jgi:ubiquinone/menaquinone biosynthesis C-methylase UbiE
MNRLTSVFIRSEEERRSLLALQIKRDWDQRAIKNPIVFTAPKMEQQTPDEFFYHGKKQARAFSNKGFSELNFEPAGKRMLEIGCGIGRLLTGFAEMFTEVWGVDVSSEMIAQAAKNIVSPKVKLVQNNGLDLAGIPESYFEFVFSYNTLQHVPEKWIIDSYLAETFRILKPSGIFQLHFRTNKEMNLRNYIYWHIPDPFQKLAQIIFRSLALYQLRGLPLQTQRTPGSVKTWVGTGFSPVIIENKLTQLGFTNVKTLIDETMPIGMKFWIIGRKPHYSNG